MMIASSYQRGRGFHMTPSEMDEVFDRHCAAEAANDIEAILDTLTDDAEHDVVGDPAGVVRGREAIAQRDKELCAALAEDKMEPLRRHHGEGFFVDESRYLGRVIGPFMGFPGGNTP